MQITYLGHAGFCVETSKSIIIMDPWLSTQGAFDAAWFQYPKNHHMADYVQHILTTSTKDKYIYISHEHKDHFDINFLQSLKARNFTILLANYAYPLVKRTLDEVNYQCKKIVLLDDSEQYLLKDGVVVLFVMDTELNCDSAILVKSASGSFLNLNDCKIHDRLETIVNTFGNVDIFTAQFSGASWYPTCYQMSKDAYVAACQEKIISKFAATAEAIQKIKPKLYLPSAGPPCFLDPMLIHFNFQDINSYPRAHELILYLDQHREAMKVSTKWMEVCPGDDLDVTTLKLTQNTSNIVQDKHFKSYVVAYAKDYQKMFAARDDENKKTNPHDVFIRLKKELLEKINEMHSVTHMVHTLLYWRLTECPEKMYCIDLANKTIEITSAIHELNHYCRITAPAWLVNKVLTREISWPDFALTFRVTIERVPEIYNTILHGFLILDTEKLHSFCEKMARSSCNKERVIIEYNGKRYSILRYCPHQGADLSQGHFEGCHLVCPKHQWHFDMTDKGRCQLNESSIKAIYIGDVKKPSH